MPTPTIKKARITDDDSDGSFRVEYDNGHGSKSDMRLEATTYEKAVLEAREFLGLQADNIDPDGVQWEML